jgi:hypothetical protein
LNAVCKGTTSTSNGKKPAPTLSKASPHRDDGARADEDTAEPSNSEDSDARMEPNSSLAVSPEDESDANNNMEEEEEEDVNDNVAEEQDADDINDMGGGDAEHDDGNNYMEEEPVDFGDNNMEEEDADFVDDNKEEGDESNKSKKSSPVDLDGSFDDLPPIRRRGERGEMSETSLAEEIKRRRWG